MPDDLKDRYERVALKNETANPNCMIHSPTNPHQGDPFLPTNEN
jgi:hypothetical protein